jgi:signal transduction histidine kinase
MRPYPLTYGPAPAEDDSTASTEGVRVVEQAVLSDPAVVLGNLALALAEGAPLAQALTGFAGSLGLRTAVVRSAAGELLGVGGEVLHAVPHMRALPAADPTLELPLGGAPGGSLTVVGARPSQLPVLRAAAAVLGLATVPLPAAEDLLAAAEHDRDELADALHDGPVQSLVVARYAADAAVRGGDPVVARDAVQRALVELRRTLWHVRPRGAGGLLEALQHLSAQHVDAGGAPLDVVGDLAAARALRGAAATLAFRVVQAVARPEAPPVRVVVREVEDSLVLELEGASALTSPERWVHRVRALSGDLSARPGRLRLVLPLAPSSTDARTSP